MKTLKINSFEGKYAICTDKDKSYFAIERGELPSGAKKGDIILIDENGDITVKSAEQRER